jgi:hypothetical protein
VILTVLGLNLVLILAIGGLTDRCDPLQRVAEPRQTGDAGARLHLRFVTLFAMAAVAPAVIVALFYGVLVTRGVDKLVQRPGPARRSKARRPWLPLLHRGADGDYIGDHTALMAHRGQPQRCAGHGPVIRSPEQPLPRGARPPLTTASPAAYPDRPQRQAC